MRANKTVSEDKTPEYNKAMANNNIEIINKNLRNLGFKPRHIDNDGYTVSRIWDFEGNSKYAASVRVMVGYNNPNVSIIKFDANMCVKWQVKNMDADSVPFLAINAVIEEAVRS